MVRGLTANNETMENMEIMILRIILCNNHYYLIFTCLLLVLVIIR